MIKAIITDDEPFNVINLQRLLQQHCPEVIVVATASNAAAGIESIQQYAPDLLFLDIQMPGTNGFDMLQALTSYQFEVIFVTAFDKYGIKAVKFAALDYLLKPLDIEELKQAVTKALIRITQKKQNLQLENFVEILRQGHEKGEHRIALPSQKETRFVYTKNIIRCESSNSYTHFSMADGEKVTVSVSIYEYEDLLAAYGFIRCHQSHLVNRKFVKSMIKESGGYLLMYDGSQIPVSRHKKEQVKKALM